MLRPIPCRVFVLAALLTLCVLSGCKRKTARQEVAYVSATQMNLRDRVAAVYNKVGTVQNGDRVEVLERSRRFVRVKTPRGEEGWIEQRYLVGPDVYDALSQLAAENASSSPQARATAHTSLNLHVEPGRDTEHLYQLKEGEKLEVLKRATAERPQSRPAPGAVAHPAARPEPAVTPKSSPPKQKDKPEKTEPAPPVIEDWLLIRDAYKRTGWVLARLVDIDVPLEIAQYSEGQRFVAFFVLNQVTDEAKRVSQYLVLLTENKDGLPWDFNQIRVFTWNTKRHRYETAYRERNFWGVLPARVATDDFGKEGTLPTFTVRVKNEDGSIIDRKYKLNGPIVRRVLSPEEQKRSLLAPAHSRCTAPAASLADQQPF